MWPSEWAASPCPPPRLRGARLSPCLSPPATADAIAPPCVAAPLNSAAASGSASREEGAQCREWLASWLDEAFHQCSRSSGGSGGSGDNGGSGDSGGSGTTIPPATATAAAAAGSEEERDVEGGGAAVDESEAGGKGGGEEAEREVGQLRAVLRELEGCVSHFSDASVVCTSVDTAAAADADAEEGCGNERNGGAEPREQESGPQIPGGDGAVPAPSAPSAASAPSASAHPASNATTVAGSREGHQAKACAEEGDSKEGEEGGEGGAGRGGVVVVMVCEDTGGGIPPEELQWVLDPEGQAAVEGRGSVLLQRGGSIKWQAAVQGKGDLLLPRGGSIGVHKVIAAERGLH
ncbi:unnamed protein product [Closterium sp. NIES-53]